MPSLLAVGTFVQNIGVLEVAPALAGMGPTTLSIGLTPLLVTASLSMLYPCIPFFVFPSFLALCFFFVSSSSFFFCGGGNS